MARIGIEPWTTRPLLAGVLFVGLCAGAAPPAQTPDSRSTRSRMGEALVQPLTDLNLHRQKVDPVLLKAAAAPYAEPKGCSEVTREIARLDAVLGPDVDAPPPQGGTIRRAGSNMAVDALRGATTGWIPYRGVVRRLTGAEKRAEISRHAVLAGTTRRAYLKGIGQHMGCFAPTFDVPAMPVKTEVATIAAPPPAAGASGAPMADAPVGEAPAAGTASAAEVTLVDAPASAESAGVDAVDVHATGDTARNAGLAQASSYAEGPR